MYILRPVRRRRLVGERAQGPSSDPVWSSSVEPRSWRGTGATRPSFTRSDLSSGTGQTCDVAACDFLPAEVGGTKKGATLRALGLPWDIPPDVGRRQTV
eukprot:scaffold434_cov186-Pinguiococcus_pyrenoidosus.AAC.148